MPERRRSGTAKINPLTSAIADVAPVQERLTPLAHPSLSPPESYLQETKHERGLFRLIRQRRDPS